MKQLGKVAMGVAGGLAVLAGVGWAGLQVPPSNLPPPDDKPRNLGTITMPANLPAPVSRYLQVALGDQVPRIDSLVVLGRARANFGIWLPLRYRLVHRPGHDFERYMEVTCFGVPILKAIDRYVNGSGMTGPIGSAATGPAIDQGANMILWAEAPLMPSLWVTDERLRWVAVDENSARLIFPFGDQQDELTVHFDEATGLIRRMSALRYRDEQSGKIPWRADFLTWQTVNDARLPARISITWEDQGEPWSHWDLEQIYWNVDISSTFPDAALSTAQRFLGLK